jgi:hypothetical protein
VATTRPPGRGAKGKKPDREKPDPACGPAAPDLHGTGFETAEQLNETARRLGRDFGPAWMPTEEALGRGAAPNRHIDGGTQTRKALVEHAALEGERAARTRVKTVKARKRVARQAARTLKSACKELKAQLPDAVQRVRDRRYELDQAIDHYLLDMPRVVRGYFKTSRPVIAVAIAVATFDAWVLHAALEYSGMSDVVVWGTTLTVPLLIIGINHAFGVLAGAIGLRTPSGRRLQLAAALLVAGFGAAVTGFLMLMIFRAQAVDAQNATIRALAHGNSNAELSFFVSPLWLGPLQIAGSFAVLSLTALWTMAKGGREYVELVIEPLTLDWEEAGIALTRLEERVEKVGEQLAEATLVEHEVEVDGVAAGVAAEIVKRQLKAARKAEEGLGTAAKALYESTERYEDKIARNGRVWRVAMPTEHPRHGEPHTTGPRDVSAEASPPRYPQRTSARRRGSASGAAWRGARRNGHSSHGLDPDQLRPL